MTDKSLETAAEEQFPRCEYHNDIDQMMGMRIAFKQGAAYQKERMRCGKCKHDLKAWTCARGVTRPARALNVPRILPDFGCVLFEEL